jgi:hypothetical protein
VQFSVDQVLMHFDVKSLLHLRNRPGELNPGTAFAHFVNLEAMILEPACDLVDVGIGWSVKAAKIGGMKPMVEVGRLGVVLARIKGGQGRFLFWAAFEDKNHSLKQLVRVDRSLVEFRARRGMSVSRKAHDSRVIHPFNDTRRDQGSSRLRIRGNRRLCNSGAMREESDE